MTAVTVVIPTHNRRAGLEAMMGDLVAQRTAENVSFEVLVIDSDEGADVRHIIDRARAAGLEVRRILTRNVVAAKRNVGAKEALGDLLIFADDDMRLPPLWLQAHVEAHVGRDKTMVCGAVEFPKDWVSTSNYYRYKNSRHLNSSRPMLDGAIPAHRVVTMNGSIPRDLYLELGGMSEDFERYGGEDVELGFRLARAGVVLQYSSEALAEHHEVTANVIEFMHKVRVASLSGDRVLDLAPEAANAPTFRWTEPGVRRSWLDTLVHAVLMVLAQPRIVDALGRGINATDRWPRAYSPLAYKILTLLATQLGVKARRTQQDREAW